MENKSKALDSQLQVQQHHFISQSAKKGIRNDDVHPNSKINEGNLSLTSREYERTKVNSKE